MRKLRFIFERPFEQEVNKQFCFIWGLYFLESNFEKAETTSFLVCRARLKISANEKTAVAMDAVVVLLIMDVLLEF